MSETDDAPLVTVSPGSAGVHGPRRAWAAVGLLTLVGTLNYVDRFLPSVLAEPIKHDLALSDTAIGVINGFGFLIVYAVLGIAVARVADRGTYGAVIAACLTLWGSMTMLGGAVQSGFQLALTRVGVAVGEAEAPRPPTRTWPATSRRTAVPRRWQSSPWRSRWPAAPA